MAKYLFKNRKEAGIALAEKLKHYSGKDDALILALPKGGVPVAFEIANILSLPLDLLMIGKLGVPGNEELVMGVIAMHNVSILHNDIIDGLRIAPDDINKLIQNQTADLLIRNLNYRNGKSAPYAHNKTIIVVDDGIANLSTMRAAISALRKENAKKIIIATPVGSKAACNELRTEADEVICLFSPEPFNNTKQWYNEFPQVSPAEIKEFLNINPVPESPMRMLRW